MRRRAERTPSSYSLKAAFLKDVRRLARDALVVAAIVGVAGFLVYHHYVRSIRNVRPLGGANVLLSTAAQSGGSELSFAETAGRHPVIVGTSNRLVVYLSRNGGASWQRTPGPAAPHGTCAFGWPRVLAGANGREYVAFLAGSFCGDLLTPYLVVSSRPGPGGAWSPPVRVAPKTWKYGFDDAPDLALDEHSGRLYAVWTRGIAAERATVELSSSDDGGRTWTRPHDVWSQLNKPHLATVAVAADGTVYVTGIDADIGMWITRSTNGGKSFELVHRVANLNANPATGDCSIVGGQPIPKELTRCSGPNPTVLVDGKRVLVVYDDFGANGTQDVLISGMDARLRPLFVASVSPPDRGQTSQFSPAATIDASTGAIWACWYDTTFDPNAHRAWFTCSASKDGRRWTPPERAAAVPSMTSEVQYYAGTPGLYPSVTAAGGVAHAFWADTRSSVDGVDVYTAALPERAAFRLSP